MDIGTFFNMLPFIFCMGCFIFFGFKIYQAYKLVKFKSISVFLALIVYIVAIGIYVYALIIGKPPTWVHAFFLFFPSAVVSGLVPILMKYNKWYIPKKYFSKEDEIVRQLFRTKNKEAN
jgi:hypothetical protein